MKKMKWVDEFRAFALKGNMVDLAIGVIIGVAFSKVVSSLVSDILMPPLGLLVGGIDFTDFHLLLKWPGSSKEPVALNYGMFLNKLIDFVIVALAVFGLVKAMNHLRGNKPADVKNKKCPECLSSIPIEARRCSFCCSTLETFSELNSSSLESF